jgi:hypothetical protein
LNHHRSAYQANILPIKLHAMYDIKKNRFPNI